MTVDWPTLGTTPTLDGLDPAVKQSVTRAAVDYLSRWSGGVYGLTAATIRPERVWRGKWLPIAVGGRWYALACRHCDGQFCCCERPQSLKFPFRVHEIARVVIDGTELDPGSWTLQGHRVLHRHVGGWPTRQTITLPDREEDTFAVDLVRGLPVPEGGQIAAGVLTEEIAKAVAGDGSCKLPARVQTITRQGVTVGMFDSMDDLADGRTGLWLVDSWLTSVMEAPRVGGIWSPDHDPGRVSYQ